MTTPNTLRRLNWLWKHRHTHDGDTLQNQITVIRETIERDADTIGSSGSGAYVHLWTVGQTIAVDGGSLEFSSYGLFPPFEFSETFPVTEVTIRKPGYYNIDLEDLAWESYTGGGTVKFVHIRGGVETVTREFTSTYGRETDESISHAIPCEVGDKIRIDVDHDDSAAHDLVSGAKVAIYLVDGAEGNRGATEATVTDKITSTDEATTHTIAMTSAQTSGDLMLMFLVTRGATWTSYPSGWTVLENNFQWHSAQNGHMSVLYKVSDGTESNVTAETSSERQSVHGVWVISSQQDYSTATPDIATAVQASDNIINPPAVTVSHGAGIYLSFVLIGRNGSEQEVTTSPNNYSIFLENNRGFGSNDPGMNVFDAKVNIETSEDPSTVQIGTGWLSEGMGATTVAVKI